MPGDPAKQRARGLPGQGPRPRLRVAHAATASSPRCRWIACAENDAHDGDPEADRDVSDPECQQAVPGDGAVHCQPHEGSGDHRDGDEKIEMRDPWLEDRSGLAVEEDRQGENHALRDQESDLAGEGHPREIVEQLDQLWVPFRAEGREEPEQVGQEKDRGAAGRARDHAVREDRGAMSHPPNLHHDQRQKRDQPHREPIEDDHAVANAGEVLRIAVEGCNLLRRHRWRHRMHEARKQQEDREPDDAQHGQRPKQDQLAIGSSHRLESFSGRTF